MNGNCYIGLDPSYAAFGIAIIDTEGSTVILDQFKANNHHDFMLMCWSIVNICNDIETKYIDYIKSEETYIGQEAPIASGINSGKLNALGEHFYNTFGSMSNYKRIKTYHPMKLKTFHHKKKYEKKDTIEVVNRILQHMTEVGYTIDIRYSRVKKSIEITDGEADAFMYAIKSYIDNRPESSLTSWVLEEYPRFAVIESLEEKYK